MTRSSSVTFTYKVPSCPYWSQSAQAELRPAHNQTTSHSAHLGIRATLSPAHAASVKSQVGSIRSVRLAARTPQLGYRATSSCPELLSRSASMTPAKGP